MDEKRKQLIQLLKTYAQGCEEKDIAVIGVSGRYPEAENLDEFWDNVRSGKNCIGEIPADRWDWRLHKEESYSRWGGFLKDVDAFDPLFFHISPREAEAMDPQERLFLEVCWAVMEDAGYTRQVVAEMEQEIGVFVGVMNCNYEWLSGRAAAEGIETNARGAYWSIANRVSYFFDFQGPSMAVDTACSSSLTALHLACQSLKRGECRMAICGGVNLVLSPAHYRRLCEIEMIAPDDRCKSFGEGADGFVDGEGVGAVLLKPLPQAVEDGDKIIGIIKGTAVNAGGKTSGYSVPNPNAQARVISDALRRSRIHPRTISYVEAHGTGTALGDPIEILGLTRAYSQYTNDKQFCAVGSLKSNMGHMESAAGIAAITKILMQMRYRRLVPSLHSERLNPNIDFASSPFFVQRESADWRQPQADIGNGLRSYPRRAAVSSFGAGGANAHVVLEEYIAPSSQESSSDQALHVFPLSAKTREQLRIYVKRMLNFLDKHGEELLLLPIAYTLQMGREAMDERLAFYAGDMAQLRKQLSEYYQNGVEPEAGPVPEIHRWLAGETVDWSVFYPERKPTPVSLPTYPFAKNRFPLPTFSQPAAAGPKNRMTAMRFRPGWEEIEAGDPTAVAGCVLVLGSGPAEANYLEHRLSELAPDSGEVVIVAMGDRYSKTASNEYRIDPASPEDYRRLLADLWLQKLRPDYILHDWARRSEAGDDPAVAAQWVLEAGVEPVFHIMKTLANQNIPVCRRFLFTYQEGEVDLLCEAVGAFARSLKLSFPEMDFLTLQYDRETPDTVRLDTMAYLLWNPLSANILEFKVSDGRLFARTMTPVQLPGNVASLFRRGGVYLITGGCGGLGWIVASHLAKVYGAAIVLTGRSPLDQAKEHKLRELERFGGSARYISADVSDLDAMGRVMGEIERSFGRLNGVLHSAGIIDDTVFYNKEWRDFSATLKPKMAGTVALDLATAGVELDVFVVFSSASSVLGDIGQCDYALGNRFLDCYMEYRNTLRQRNARSGAGVSINWPVWRNGGMHLDDSGEALFLKAMGLDYLEDEDGLAELETIVASGLNRILVLYGQKDRVYRNLGIGNFWETPKTAKTGDEEMNIQRLTGCAAAQVRQIAASVIRLDPAMFNDKENFGNYGFDSITLKEFAGALKNALQVDISPTIFFQHSSIEALSGYLAEHFPGAISGRGMAATHEDEVTALVVEPAVEIPVSEASDEKDIAIIGAASRLPGSRNLAEFWRNLVEGRDLITEIPAQRWDWRQLDEDSRKNGGKTVPRWGGFVPDADTFDARFFTISPREAELIDPQQRLLCQIVWEAFEDGGYRPSDFSGKRVGVFVGAESDDYVQLLRANRRMNAQMIIGNHHAVLANRISFLLNFRGASESINTACSSSLVAVHQAVGSLRAGENELAVAGGVSLMLSPHSMKAVSMLGVLSSNGRCKTFDRKADGYVRGEGVGVVLLKPLSRAIADSDHIYAVIKSSAVNHGGKANSFTAPNSGAQAALLVEAYEKAGIHPEAISYIEVHGTGTELGDPVEIDALRQAFGELAERSGRQLNKKNYCGLGTVKTYIGHLEPASGIAGLLKVILSMKHGILPKNLHFEELNPLIELKHSPFYIVNKTKNWDRLIAKDGSTIPRTAGVSAFGFGGANAHVVLEEYAPVRETIAAGVEETAQLIVLSAKTEDRLLAYAGSLLEFLERDLCPLDVERTVDDRVAHEIQRKLLDLAAGILSIEADQLDSGEDFQEMGFDGVSLAALAGAVEEAFGAGMDAAALADISTIDRLARLLAPGKAPEKSGASAHPGVSLRQIAFTLQTGREPLPWRLAFVAPDTEELKDKLRRCREADFSRYAIFKGRAGDAASRAELSVAADDDESKFEALAQAWVSGADINWMSLHSGVNPGRVSLPTYPFAPQRHWFDESQFCDADCHLDGQAPEARLHPLVGSNTSTFLQQRYSSCFSGHEFFLDQHRVQGVKVLPGVAYLEMARAAGELAAERSVRHIRNIVWSRPIVFGGKKPSVQVNVSPSGPDAAEFTVVTRDGADGEAMVHARGILSYNGAAPVRDALDIEAVKRRCGERREGADCYQRFLEGGLAYGPAFQALHTMWRNETETLARLELPEVARVEAGDYLLHPSILDAALQSVAGLTGDGDRTASPRLPFTLGKIDIFERPGEVCYAYAVRASSPGGTGDIESFDITIADANGNVAAALSDFTLKAMSSSIATDASAGDRTLSFQWVWKADDEAGAGQEMNLQPDRAVWSLFPTQESREALERALESRGAAVPVVEIRAGEGFSELSPTTWSIDPLCAGDMGLVISECGKRNLLPGLIIVHAGEEDFSLRPAESERRTGEIFFPLFHLAGELARLRDGHPVRLFHVYRCAGEEVHPLRSALSALFRTVWREHPHIAFCNVCLRQSSPLNQLQWLAVAKRLLRDSHPEQAEFDLAYEESDSGRLKKYIRTLREFSLRDNIMMDLGETAGFRRGAVYIITGGAGGIGMILAEYLVTTCGSRVALADIAPPSPELEAKLAEIGATQADITFIQTDLCDEKAVRALLAACESRFGAVNGIIHCAGVTRDALLLEKTDDQATQVFKPKIHAAMLLDEVFGQEDLDLFILFSSTSVLGNAGQADYAFANHFLDHFALWREGERKRGRRKGRTISINWPLWRDGGMRVDNATLQMLEKAMGVKPLPTATGIEVLLDGLAANGANFLVVHGHGEKIQKVLSNTASGGDAGRPSAGSLLEKVQRDCTELAARILKINPSELELDGNLHEWGFDSINLTEFANNLNETYGLEITPAIFFESGESTVANLASSLLQKYPELLTKYYSIQLEEGTPGRFVKNAQPDSRGETGRPDAIAIIGMSGVLPLSGDLEEFWRHIVAGDDLITEAPRYRWDWQTLYPDKPHAARGGFIQSAREFDAEFFGISPREAVLMEPQQRIFMQTVWKTIEDAGYSTAEFSGTDTAVFVGVSASEYNKIFPKDPAKPDPFESTGIANSILVNRISYMLDIHGPSEAIDTACSSSLVAIHRAVTAIRAGECRMALAGGVNVLLTPDVFLTFDAAGMLSKDGRCKTFDDRADGYVRAEGAGAVLLKSLAQAIADNDHVQATIIGSAVNHGGRSHSLTAPNAAAQAELLIAAYEKTGVPPDTIGYIEAHGTGTKLGDPVEVEGLKKAFAHLYSKHGKTMPDTPRTGLGSVKSNTGHLETAAGMAGLFKVALAMKQGIIPATIHFQSLNSHIQLKGTPFYIVDKNRPWERPEGDASLRAGVSSFGFGGANAHIVLEEFRDEAALRGGDAGENVMVLSAKNQERLRQYAERTLAFLENHGSRMSLRDVCFTLQSGRNGMEARLALIAGSMDECREKLARYLREGSDGLTVFSGYNEKVRGGAAQRVGDDPVAAAKNWVSGGNVDWSSFYMDGPARRVSLPTYPFAAETFWPFGPEGVPMRAAGGFGAKTGSEQPLHILVDKNLSTFTEIVFSRVFTGQEFFIADHGNTLPAVAYIEMARAAAQLASPTSCAGKFGNIAISRPLTISGSPQEVRVTFHKRERDHWVEFQLKVGDVQHAVGYLEYGAVDEGLQSAAERLNIQEIIERSTGGETEAALYYDRINANGGKIGPRFMGMLEFYRNRDEAIAKIGIIPEQQKDRDLFVLHPVLTDAAIQTMVAFGYERGFAVEMLYLPYVAGSVEIVDPKRKPEYVYVRCGEHAATRPEDLRFNAWLLAGDGRVVVRMGDFSFRPFKRAAIPVVSRTPKIRSAFDTVYYSPCWEPTDAAVRGGATLDSSSPVLLFDDGTDVFESISSWCRPVLVRPGDRFRELGPDRFEIAPHALEDFDTLLKTLMDRDRLPALFLYLWMRNCPFLATADALEGQLRLSVYPVFNFVKAYAGLKLEHACRFLSFFPGTPEESNPVYAALPGFTNSISRENPRMEFRNVSVPSLSLEEYPLLPDVMMRECLDDTPSRTEVAYEGGRRMAGCLREAPAADETDSRQPSIVKENGVYIITGGTGGLGALFAEHLAVIGPVKLILADIGPLTPEREELLQKLLSAGAEASYVESDISSREQTRGLIASAKERFGIVNGVIHAAGIVRDALIRDKSIEQLRAVLAPKIMGAVWLDEETRGEPLDFFVMFSSLTALTGNYGQCDYGFANSFLDRFALYRERLTAGGTRRGKTLSLNWPLWENGGMKIEVSLAEEIFKQTGIKPLSTAAGALAFDWGLVCPWPQIGVLEGVRDRMMAAVTILADSGDSGDRRGKTKEKLMDGKKDFEKQLLEMVADLLKIDREKIRVDKDLSSYGFDSISFTELAQRLNRTFDFKVTPDVFFEHGTLGSIAGYLVEEYSSHWESEAGDSPGEDPVDADVFAPAPTLPATFSPTDRAAAIIGMSGRFPQSEDLDSFWKNLSAGRPLITTIPPDRWDWREYRPASSRSDGDCATKWGGFMPDADKFDPLFFNIAPRDAELMDPQSRLFLETSWHVVEDAGYAASRLRGENIGVFVGVSTFDYQKTTELVDRSSTEQLHFMVANRVSYFMDWRGPSEAIDTACSSSLVAVHRAIDAIRAGECRMAVAGGVNLLADPYLFLIQAGSGMLSPNGTCYTFDKRANGYVRGEGVGAVLLKPLQDARRDGDHIYAVIRGSGVNHGGHTNSFSTPNPTAQAELLRNVHEAARIDPDTIGYIEAHGTGTSLGDPLEINALKKAFEHIYAGWNKPIPAQPHILVGTVKTHIGHLESAAGIAGLITVVLAMIHRAIPGNRNFEELNPYIKLDDSPFAIARYSTAWKRLADENGEPVPRRAGISSFGIGGANAHIILEEYRAEDLPLREPALQAANRPALFVLSARNRERLQAYAVCLREYLQTFKGNHGGGWALEDIAYTLQTGRDAMAERLAVLAVSQEELLVKLTGFIEGDTQYDGVFAGNVKNRDGRLLVDGEEGEVFLRSLLEKGKLEKIAALWAAGTDLDWRLLYGRRRMRRLPLPVYPFARKRLWVSLPSSGKRPDIIDEPESFHYITRWKEASPQESIAASEPEGQGQIVFVYGSEGEALKTAVSAAYAGEGKIELSFDDAFDQKRFSGVGSEGCVIYFFGGIREVVDIERVEDFAGIQEKGVVALFRLVKQLCSDGLSLRPLAIKIVTNDGCPVSGAIGNPYCASLHGFAAVLAREFPRWTVSCVDISIEEFLGPRKDAVIDAIVREPGHLRGSVSALRGGSRYIRVLEPAPFSRPERSFFKEKGTYLIVGGAGRIGMDVCGYLAKNFKANLILTGRKPLAAAQADEIARLQSLGAAIVYFEADVTDETAMRECVAACKERFGALNGVIHSAMAIANQAVENMDETVFCLGLAPKVAGAFLLQHLLREEDLDFLLFFSSAQSFIAEAGMANYVAGNVFEDALAAYLDQRRRYPVRVINWGYWQRDSDVLDERVRLSMEKVGLVPFSAQEGLAAVESVLSNPAVQMLVLRGREHLLREIGVSRPASSILERALSEAGRPKLADGQWQRLEEGYGEVEESSRYLLLRAFQTQGVFLRGGEQYTRGQLEDRLGIIPQYSRLFDELLDILQRGGFLDNDGPRLGVSSQVEHPQVVERIKDLDRKKTSLVERYPDVTAYVTLLWICLERYFEMLQGRVPATDILFPGSSMELMEGLYKGNSQADYFNDLLVWSIDAYIRDRLRSLKEGQLVTILEVGAGTGGTTGRILERINRYKDRIQYIYTDISRAFIHFGQKRFGTDYPFVRFAVLNIEKNLESQGFAPGSCDVVIGANVVHATSYIKETVSNIKRLLATHGWLVMNEGTAMYDYGTMMFGLLEGWWLYRDEENRNHNCPLLSGEKWRQILQQEGFRRVAVLGRSPMDETAGKQHIIIGESDGKTRAVSVSGAVAPLELEAKIVSVLCSVLKIEGDDFDRDLPFSDFGVDSILAIEIVNNLNARLGIELRTTDLFNYPTIKKLVDYIEPRFQPEAAVVEETIAALPAPDTGDRVEHKIMDILQAVTKLDADDIDLDAPYTDYGVDSILAIDIVDRINRELGIELRSTDLFNYASVNKLTRYIVETFPGAGAASPKREIWAQAVVAPVTVERTIAPVARRTDEIAIIGMSGRFPGADDVDTLWENLVAGVDSVTEAERWNIDTFFDPDPKAPNKSYCKWGGFLKEIDRFDSLFFSISPMEAEMMDPQQRLFLEEAYNALVDAAYADRDMEGVSCGTFVGFNGSDYSRLLDIDGISPNPYRMTGNYEAMLSARLTYYLNLRGPSVTINTACSSSLVAFHLACESIRCKTSDMAIAGGVSVMTTPGTYILLSKTEVLSFRGQCRAFDNGADGVVLAEGAAAVVLKPLDAAQRDGDHIYAVVCASGLNQDGRSNGITAPSATSQTDLLSGIYRTFNIDPEHISYIETHGTGTRLGDPIEIDALTDAFGLFTNKRQFCAIGSVKTNIGHSTAASGVTGLIKVLLCLKNRRLVPSLHFDTPNQFIDFKQTPFYVHTDLTEWKTTGGRPLMAAVSCFGFSGTNAHVVLREAAMAASAPGSESDIPFYPVPISAKTDYSLKCSLRNLYDWILKNSESYSLADISFTLTVGRSHHSIRHMVIVRDMKELIAGLKAALAGEELPLLLSSDLEGGRFKPDPASVREGETLLSELGDGALPREQYRQKLQRLAQLYCEGYSLQWRRLFSGGQRRRIPLPTYPFDRQRYWPDAENSDSALQTGRQEAALHPLLDANESTLQEVLFRKAVSMRDLFVADARCEGKARFPALASLEMVCAAVKRAGGVSGAGRLMDCVWGESAILNGQGVLELYIGLYPGSGFIWYEIFSAGEAGERYVHAQGKHISREGDGGNGRGPLRRLPKDAVMLRCDDPIEKDMFYGTLTSYGLEYGAALQVISQFRAGEGECLCRVETAVKSRTGDAGVFTLHPALLEGVWQALAFMMGYRGPGAADGPVTIGKIEWIGSLPPACNLYVRQSTAAARPDGHWRMFDAELADEDWNIVMTMTGIGVEAASSEQEIIEPPGPAQSFDRLKSEI